MKRELLLIITITAILVQLIEAKRVESAEPAEPNSTQINSLNQQVEGMEQRLRQLESGREAATATPVDPLLGKWGCSNRLQSSKLTFFTGGQVLFEEPTLGSIERATWSRIDSKRVVISGSLRYEISFNAKDEFEYTEANTRSTGTCQRLP